MSPALSWFLAALGLALVGGCSAVLGALRGIARARIPQAVPDERERARLVELLESERELALTAIALRALGFSVAAVGIAGPTLVGGSREAPAVIEAVALLFLGTGLADVVPRALGSSSPESLLARTLPAFALFARLASPVVALFRFASAVALAVAGTHEQSEAEEIVTSLRSAALEGVKEGLLDPTATAIIESALEFQDRDVRDIMTPRTEIVAVPADLPLPDVVKLLGETGLSRVPVYEETPDRIVGIFYTKDVLAKELVAGGLRKLMRKPAFVPESKKVSELLKEFRRGRPHLVIVVDEHGGTAGLVTVADVVEEILGHIRDEDDPIEGPRIRRQPDGAFEVAGAVRTDELAQEVGVRIPADPDYETVAGFVLTQLGRIPAKGESFAFDGVRIQVLDADERRVKRLRLVRAGASAVAPAGTDR